jgi:hypothetical protein
MMRGAIYFTVEFRGNVVHSTGSRFELIGE